MSYLHSSHVEIIDHQFTINRKIEQMELRWLAEQTPSNGMALILLLKPYILKRHKIIRMTGQRVLLDKKVNAFEAHLAQ